MLVLTITKLKAELQGSSTNSFYRTLDKFMRERGTIRYELVPNTPYLNKFLGLPKNPGNFPVVENLVKYINPLMQDGRCFGIVHNYRGANLAFYQLENPVIIMKPQLGLLERPLSINYALAPQLFSWAPEGLAISIVSDKFGYPVNCTFSTFLASHPMQAGVPWEREFGSICTTLKFIQYSVSGKPWNCVVELKMFPYVEAPTLADRFVKLPDIFSYNLEELPTISANFTYPAAKPSSVIPIRVFVVSQTSEHVSNLSLSNLVSEHFSLKEIAMASHTFTNLDKFILANTIITRNFSNLTEAVGRIEYIVELVACGYCPFKLQQSAYPSLIKWTSDELSIRSRLFEYLNSLESTSDTVYGFDASFVTFRITNRCDKVLPPQVVNLALLYAGSMSRHVDAEFACVWKSILKNFTFIEQRHLAYFDRIVDEDGDVPGFLTVVQMNHVFPFQAQYYPATYLNIASVKRFVSCGHNDISPMPYTELLKSFSCIVWIYLVVVQSLTTFVITRFGAGVNYGTQLLGNFKVLLEQGDPFLSVAMKFTRLRIIIAGLLLSGVVLSNAYKNTNVYNLITLRKVIPYSKLSELVADKFEIFVQSSPLKHIVASRESIKNNKRAKWRTHTFESYAEFEGITTFILETDIQPYKHLHLPSVYDYVYQHVKLHPTLKDIAFRILNATQNSWIWNNFERSIEMIKAKFFIEQRDMHLQLLKNCTRMALILPEIESLAFSEEVRKLSRNPYVSIGKEVYFDFQMVYNLWGRVSPWMLSRVNAVTSAGIWQRWMRINRDEYSTKIKTIQDHDPIRSPTMAGNILVIFQLHSFGLFIGLVAFGGEHFKSLKDYFHKTILAITNCLSRVLSMLIRVIAIAKPTCNR